MSFPTAEGLWNATLDFLPFNCVPSTRKYGSEIQAYEKVNYFTIDYLARPGATLDVD